MQPAAKHTRTLQCAVQVLELPSRNQGIRIIFASRRMNSICFVPTNSSASWCMYFLIRTVYPFNPAQIAIFANGSSEI
ncbi:hypothetical protein CY34DRAFT_804037 [Suillus luteus UH-Slu-Lm8-n1]|uniref:Uncharacterized protein n=1 Tax=Suillus luteus UH-Slu-Lm8-n1 TaxID=930992 RepID=A0A0D0BAB0_9AGAM|nr:hypothetical protein CY34DRAFT_804037 [Suillus luteus UH-Slu-Lm8-n1]